MTYRAGIILSAQNLQLTSQLYIGGLPTGYVVNIHTCIQKKATKIDVVHVNTFFFNTFCEKQLYMYTQVVYL